MRRRIFILLAVLGCTVSPAAAQQRAMSAAQRAALTDTIHQQAQKFIAALASRDGAQFRSLFSSDITYVDAGKIYPSREALVTAATGFFRRQRSIGGTFAPEKITILGPNAAAYTGVFHAAVVDTAGKPGWQDGKVWTLVYERRDGKWQIVQAAEANGRK
jgi:uncharacterized protein (TIGR02246 family)